METVFDHNLNNQEYYIFRHLAGEKDGDKNMRALSILFGFRKDPEKAREYASKIRNRELREEQLSLLKGDVIL